MQELAVESQSGTDRNAKGPGNMSGAPMVSATGSNVQAGSQDFIRANKWRDYSVVRERMKDPIHFRVDI